MAENAFGALNEAFLGVAQIANTYRQADAPRIQYEATKISNDIKLNLDTFAREAKTMPYAQIPEKWTEAQQNMMEIIENQNPEIQYALREWWDNTKTTYQMSMDTLVDQKWRSEEFVGIQQQIDELSALGTDDAVGGIRGIVESAHSSGIIDAQTAYRLSTDAIGKINYNKAKGAALQILEEKGVDTALEFAMLGDVKLDPQKRAALRSEISTIYADRQNQIIRLDRAANTDASTVAERIIDNELPLNQMDRLIETDQRMTGETRLKWRNWMLAQQDAALRAKDAELSEEDKRFSQAAVNRIIQEWEQKGPKAEQTDKLLELFTNGYITKNEYDDYRSTVSKDPITEPEFDDGLRLIKSTFEKDQEGMEKALALFRSKVYEDRYVAGQLNPNRLRGQDLAQVAQNIAAGNVLRNMIMDKFRIGGTNTDRFTLNDVERNVLDAQNGKFLGITDQSAELFNQIETHQGEMFEQLVGPVERVTRNRNGLPEFHYNGRKFMFAIPTDGEGNPTAKDETLIIHMGGDEWTQYDWRKVNEEKAAMEEQARMSDPQYAAAKRSEAAKAEEQRMQQVPNVPTVSTDTSLSPLQQELDLLRQQLSSGGQTGGHLWDTSARRKIKEIAERRGLPESAVLEAAKSVGLVDEGFRLDNKTLLQRIFGGRN